MEDPLTVYAVVMAAACIAGIMNSVAGGGTLLTFPALIAFLSTTYGDTTGAIANATSTVALMPGSLAGVWAYRRELSEARAVAISLLPASFVGGLLGALLLIWKPSQFTPLIPALLLFAAILFLIQPAVNRFLKSRRKDIRRLDGPVKPTLGLQLFQLMIAIYGGYFGAGMGIVILATLGLMGVSNIHQANGVKTVLASVVNSVAIVVFAVGGLVHWPLAGAMAVAAIGGGYVGARVARQLPAQAVRLVIVVVAFGLAAYYAVKQFMT